MEALDQISLLLCTDAPGPIYQHAVQEFTRNLVKMHQPVFTLRLGLLYRLVRTAEKLNDRIGSKGTCSATVPEACSFTSNKRADLVFLPFK